MTPLTGPLIVVEFWTCFRLPSRLMVKVLKEPFNVVRPSLRQYKVPRAASRVNHEGLGPQPPFAEVAFKLYLPLDSAKESVVTSPA